jgi:hypothetical protein
MNNLNDLINELRNLDLRTRPENEIIELFRMIGTTVNINLKIDIGTTFLKARRNRKHPRFTETKDLSIKPGKDNIDYQRASTPLNTMFYGVYMSGIIGQKELDIMRTTGVYETIPEIRIPNQPFQEKVTFGYWTNKKSLNLMALMHKKTYASNNPYTKELVEAYKKHLQGCDNMLKENSLTLYDFLADEFSKETIRGNYDYMISALFSEAASRSNIDGVIYPSVRVGGVSYNVAITELAVQKLELYRVEEATVNQTGNKVNIAENAFAKLKENQDRFTLIDI